MSSTIQRPAVQEFRPSFSELPASEEPDLIREPLRRWIAVHGEESSARFVYGAWLSAMHEPGIVHGAIGAWIERHGLRDSARFVYAAWLAVDGERTVVQEPIRRWLAIHGDEPAARFVLVAWLMATKDPHVFAAEIDRRLAAHADDPVVLLFSGTQEGGASAGRLPRRQAHLRHDALRRGPQRRPGSALVRLPLRRAFTLSTYVHLLDNDLGAPLTPKGGLIARDGGHSR
ncbi:MAG: hypothetical protein ACRDK4_07545 [Solirubrobacteraceae bacterium]